MNLKKINLKITILIIVSILFVVFVYHDYFLYKTPILKIKSINTKEVVATYSDEIHYTQEITGIIKNGKYKGKELTVINTTSTSGVYDEQIHEKSELFLELTEDGDRVVSISGIKRDKYLAILLVLFFDLIIIIAKEQGIKTLVSLGVNLLLSALAIVIFQKNYLTFNLLFLYLVVSILFIICSLYITNGKGKKTIAAIVSSIVSLFISFSLAFLLIHFFGDKIPFWNMEYIEVVYDYKNFFYVSVLLGGLGAIMDIAITISSSLNELIIKNPKIKTKDLIKSGKEIAKDIVGTMTNVMLFTCYTPIIPMVFLAIRNNILLSNALKLFGDLELIIILCSCISIVLAIPISLYISTVILNPSKKGAKK